MASRLGNRMNKLEEENNPKGKKILRFIIKSEEDEQAYREYLDSADRQETGVVRIIRVHPNKWERGKVK